MRKWMRDRLQRRKKQTTEAVSQPAPPPLQPAYFDEAADSGKTEHEKKEHSSSGESAPEPLGQEAASAEGSVTPEASDRDDAPAREGATKSSTAGSGQRKGSRRRRGGRGRGSRTRERAVAQSFAPSSVKGAGLQSPAEPIEELQPETDAETEGAALPPSSAPVPIPPAPPRLPKGIVVLAIGLPGSGKSTWFKRHNVTPLSSDMVRSLLFDDIREQRFQDLVFSNLRSMLKARLIARRPMNYVDATNLTPHERSNWIKLAKDYNYEVHAVFFDVPLEVCIERHQRRDRVVPEDVMRRMAAKLKPPSFEEGFAKITVVRVKKKEASSPAAQED